MAPEAGVRGITRSAINPGDAAILIWIPKSYTFFALAKSRSETFAM